MSASRERKKRLELSAQGQSPKQLKAAAEKKRKKKNKIIGIVAAAVVVAVLVGCLYGLVIRPNAQPRKAVALQVGEHELSAVQFSYYYYDAVNNFYQNYSSYLSYLMSDPTAPLDEQVYDEDTGETWADYFIESAAESAKYDYAVYDKAVADGFSLSKESKDSIKEAMDELETSLKEQNKQTLKEYITTVYGKGASVDSYYDYQIIHQTASEYAQKIDDEREYDAEAIQAKDDENPAQYSSVTYRSYYLSADDFVEESVVDEVVSYDEDGEEETTEVDEEAQAEALAAAESVAQLMASQSNEDEEMFIELCQEYASEDNKATYEDESATLISNASYDNVSASMQDWLFDDSRYEGDTTVISDSNGCYVLFFKSLDDNDYNTVTVRQILFEPEADVDTDEDGTADSYSEDSWNKAKADAEALIESWKSGEATNESFGALSDEKTGNTDGGLYENIYHGATGDDDFEAWCFDSGRKAGDTDVIKSAYGYYAMYFVSEGKNYRESMIINDLKDADYDAWLEEITSSVEYTLVDDGIAWLRTDLVLGTSESES